MTLSNLLRIGRDIGTSAEGWGLNDESIEGGEGVSADSDWEEGASAELYSEGKMVYELGKL